MSRGGQNLLHVINRDLHLHDAGLHLQPVVRQFTPHAGRFANAAQQRGMLPQKLVTQSQFLMGIGEANQVADAFEECSLPPERAKVALQLKHLVSPAGMGESFHVVVASKGIAPETVASLSCLSFGQTQVVR